MAHTLLKSLAWPLTVWSCLGGAACIADPDDYLYSFDDTAPIERVRGVDMPRDMTTSPPVTRDMTSPSIRRDMGAQQVSDQGAVTPDAGVDMGPVDMKPADNRPIDMGQTPTRTVGNCGENSDCECAQDKCTCQGGDCSFTSLQPGQGVLCEDDTKVCSVTFAAPQAGTFECKAQKLQCEFRGLGDGAIVKCSGEAECRDQVTCVDGSCLLDCSDKGSHCHPRCESGARCQILCKNEAHCDFKYCHSGDAIECPNGDWACNAPCPS